MENITRLNQLNHFPKLIALFYQPHFLALCWFPHLKGFSE